MMQILRYQVRFTTPAFLGNAEQSGQWRTPPFKALLRQWWRVVVAPDVDYCHDKVRREEAQIFGHAWLKGDKNVKGEAVHARKSRVQIRLDRWTAGKETQAVWGERDLHKVKHPEVRRPIGPLLYLGYGPLGTKKVPGPKGGTDYATVLKKNAVIQADEGAVLSIAAPEEYMPRLETALALMNAYGTLGGRSRNGWGSIDLSALDGSAMNPDTSRFLRNWRKALDFDWPHALGQDDRPLVWQTKEAHSDWESIMRALAVCKIALRTAFKFPLRPPPHQTPQARHWLSYPVTPRHTVKAWKNKRLPNSLRFKVRRDTDGKLRGVIFHVPCLPPEEFCPHPHRQAIEQVWQHVHNSLDSNKQFERVKW